MVNARGIPGAAGAVARGSDGKRYLVTCHHVLFGGGAAAGDVVWGRGEPGARRLVPIARAAFGYQGQITVAGQVCFIDCAFAELTPDAAWPPALAGTIAQLGGVAGIGRARAGMMVNKHGWLTGHTAGVVADDRHFDRPSFDGAPRDAPGQLLIRPAVRDECFSAPGESGSAVLDEADRLVGFLWGCTTYGEGIAFPAAPALDRFAMTLEVRASFSARSHG